MSEENNKDKPILHDYQRAATNFTKNTKRAGLFLDMGLGKSTADSGKILTQNRGEITVGEVNVGDYLYAQDGSPTKVLAVFPHKNIEAYEVTLSDGRKFIASNDHQIPYYTRSSFKSNKLRNKPLKEMFDDYVTHYHSNNNHYKQYKYSIPNNEAVEFEQKDHKIHPYALGIFIGNGAINSTSLTITSSDREIIYNFANYARVPHMNIKFGTYNRNYYTYNRRAHKVLKTLTDLDLHGPNVRGGYRFIPNDYLIDSIHHRKELLTGIIDSNGSVIHSGKSNFYYQVSTSSDQLAKDIQELCRSLGYGVTVSPNPDGTNRVQIYTNDKLAKISRNTERLKNKYYKGTKHLINHIVDIKQVENQDMTCFTVKNEDSLYLINDYIVTHNTLIALTALVELAQENNLKGHVLIIAPRRIAELTWSDEIEKWGHTQGARYKVLAGLSKQKRNEALDKVPTDKPTIYIISRSTIRSVIERFPGDKWQFPNVIIDEAQSFKNPSSVGFKLMKEILPYTERLIELTGTPAPNTLIDIWSLIYMLDGGARLGVNPSVYKANHFNPGPLGPQGFPYMWFIKKGHEEIIQNQIKDVAISMKKTEYLDIPDVTHNVIELDMTNKERSIYNQLKEDMIIPLTNGGAIESSNAAVLSGALLQLANGAIYEDEDKTDIIKLHDHKLDALEDIIDGAQGQSILCWYWFKHDLARLKDRFGKDGEVFDGSEEQLKRWNNKEIPLLFAQPASAGHGLNFQHGGHIMVFFSLPRSLELYEQSIARLHRNGQKEAVIVHYLQMKDTVEGKVVQQLRNKQLTQDALLEAVKADLGELID